MMKRTISILTAVLLAYFVGGCGERLPRFYETIEPSVIHETEVVSVEAPETEMPRRGDTITAYIDGNPVEIGVRWRENRRHSHISVYDLSLALEAVGVHFDHDEFADHVRSNVSYSYSNGYSNVWTLAAFLNLEMSIVDDALYINTEPFPRLIEITLLIDERRSIIGGRVTREGFRYVSLRDLSPELEAVGINFDHDEFAAQFPFDILHHNGDAHVRWVTDLADYLNLEVSFADDVLYINASEPFPRPIEVTLLIDGHGHYRATVSALETLRGERKISVSDLSRELNNARIPFNVSGLGGEPYVLFRDISEHANFEIRLVRREDRPRDIIVVYTEDRTLREQERKTFAGFLLESYPHVIKREMIFDNFGPHIGGSWYPSSYRLFEVGDVLGVHFSLDDAGSRSGVDYLFADGSFQRLEIPGVLFHDDENRLVLRVWNIESESRYNYLKFADGQWQTTPAPDDLELIPARFLSRTGVPDYVNQQLWRTTVHASGVIVDANIPNRVIGLIFDHFENEVADDGEGTYRINEIKWSLIHDNLVRVNRIRSTDRFDLDYWYWLELNAARDEIENRYDGWFWSDYTTPSWSAQPQ